VIIETLNGSDWSCHWLAALLPVPIEQGLAILEKGKFFSPAGNRTADLLACSLPL